MATILMKKTATLLERGAGIGSAAVSGNFAAVSSANPGVISFNILVKEQTSEKLSLAQV